MAIAPACQLACLLTWPDRPLLGAGHSASWLSIVTLSPPASCASPTHISTQGNFWKCLLIAMVRKNLSKLKLKILQFCRQVKFAYWYFHPNRKPKCFIGLTQWECSTSGLIYIFILIHNIYIFILIHKKNLIFFRKNGSAFDFYEAILQAGTHWPGSQLDS